MLCEYCGQSATDAYLIVAYEDAPRRQFQFRCSEVHTFCAFNHQERLEREAAAHVIVTKDQLVLDPNIIMNDLRNMLAENIAKHTSLTLPQSMTAIAEAFRTFGVTAREAFDRAREFNVTLQSLERFGEPPRRWGMMNREELDRSREELGQSEYDRTREEIENVITTRELPRMGEDELQRIGDIYGVSRPPVHHNARSTTILDDPSPDQVREAPFGQPDPIDRAVINNIAQELDEEITRQSPYDQITENVAEQIRRSDEARTDQGYIQTHRCDICHRGDPDAFVFWVNTAQSTQIRRAVVHEVCAGREIDGPRYILQFREIRNFRENAATAAAQLVEMGRVLGLRIAEGSSESLHDIMMRVHNTVGDFIQILPTFDFGRTERTSRSERGLPFRDRPEISEQERQRIAESLMNDDLASVLTTEEFRPVLDPLMRAPEEGEVPRPSMERERIWNVLGIPVRVDPNIPEGTFFLHCENGLLSTKSEVIDAGLVELFNRVGPERRNAQYFLMNPDDLERLRQGIVATETVPGDRVEWPDLSRTERPNEKSSEETRVPGQRKLRDEDE